MAQYRRRENRAEVRLGSAIKAFLICLLIAGVAIGYVLQSHDNVKLKVELQALQEQREQLHRESVRLKNQLDELHSPLNLQRMVVAHGLDLVRVRPDQVVVLGVPGAGSPLVAQREALAPGAAMRGRGP